MCRKATDEGTVKWMTTCACVTTRSHERRCHQSICCWWRAMHGVFLYHGSLNGGKTRWQLRSAPLAAACFRHPVELILTTHVEAWTGTGGTNTSTYRSSFGMSLLWSALRFRNSVRLFVRSGPNRQFVTPSSLLLFRVFLIFVFWSWHVSS